MKLRNKKTGEIVGLSLYGIEVNIRKEEQPVYYSLAELNEEWEDYKEKEQLVKSKEIKEEIKLFAYRNEIDCFEYQARNGALFNEASNGAVISLEVSNTRELEHLVDGCIYTITELCGE